MGGALEVAGNTPGGLAEWNYHIDPTAVDAAHMRWVTVAPDLTLLSSDIHPSRFTGGETPN